MNRANSISSNVDEQNQPSSSTSSDAVAPITQLEREISNHNRTDRMTTGEVEKLMNETSVSRGNILINRASRLCKYGCKYFTWKRSSMSSHYTRGCRFMRSSQDIQDRLLAFRASVPLLNFVRRFELNDLYPMTNNVAAASLANEELQLRLQNNLLRTRFVVDEIPTSQSNNRADITKGTDLDTSDEEE
jgi:hypothetical protein